MTSYYIVFKYVYSFTQIYSGGTYTYQGERYARLGGIPKLYTSKKRAENAANKLLYSCVNTGYTFEVLTHTT